MAKLPLVPNDGRTTVLLTGFGPFPSVPLNATMMLLPQLASALPRLFPGVHFITDIIPTEWAAAPKRSKSLRIRTKPDLVVHFGVSSRARGFEIERRARNVCALAADASGATPNDTNLNERGPELHVSRLPVAEIVRRLRLRDIPAFQSWNAGTYICNATLYDALEATTARPNRVGFVHIPSDLAVPQSASRSKVTCKAAPGCPLSWPQVVLGSIEIVATCLNRPSPTDRAIAVAMAGMKQGTVLAD
jgi:pyroglutamyl-peptidase